MTQIDDYLTSIIATAEQLRKKLSDTDLEFTGPDSDADYSRLAILSDALKDADNALGDAQDAS